jgi:hypothetical protein
MKRLFLDIETSPNTCFSWRVGYKINLDYKNIIKERRIICICWKWEHEKTVKFVKWDKDQSNKEMMKIIIPVLDEADEIITHNGEAFDLCWIRTMALLYGMVTNPYYKIIDTCLFARKKLYFNSNKLDYLARFLGIGCKIKTEFELWTKVVYGDKKALDRMIKYCKMDVLLLEKVYQRLSTCMPAHSHAGVLTGGEKWSCPYCSSARVHCNCTRTTATGIKKHQMQCRKCGKIYSISHACYNQYQKVKTDEKIHPNKIRNENQRGDSLSRTLMPADNGGHKKRGAKSGTKSRR